MGAGSVTSAAPAEPAAGARQRWRSWRWVVLALVAFAVVAAISAYLTAPRPGLRMDPQSTSPDGAHALATLLGDFGVEVVVANNIADVEHAARPDTLILVAQSQYLTDETVLDRLAGRARRSAAGRAHLANPRGARPGSAPGTRKQVRQRPELHSARGCSSRIGSIRAADTYQTKDSRVVTSCYDGALIRYRDGGRTITVVGSTDFMTNERLLQEGNAALAMNLAGDRPRLIWYAPHRIEGENSSPPSVFDLIPDNVNWIVWQLWLVVLLVALWKGRRIGPLVAEELPVVVRASETVEGRGRLYRSRRARDRAASALRTATLQRLLPRLGLGAGAPAAGGSDGGGAAQRGRREFRRPPPVRPTPGHRH